MTLRATLALALMLLAGPVWAQAAKPTPSIVSDPVVARINGFELHRSDIEEAARALPPQAQRQPPDKLYMELLNSMIGSTLVAQAARKAKFQDEAEVKRHLLLVQDQVIANLYINRLVGKSLSEQKLKAEYDKYVKEAPPREEVNARHILLASEADAKAVIDQLKKGADFSALAKEKSTDPAGKTSGGDLGWFTKDQMVPEFADAAFKLKKGEFTETPIKTQFGWHVIKLEDRRTAGPLSFEQMKPQLTEMFARETIGEKMKELRAAAKIEVFNADGSPPGTRPAPVSAPAPNLSGAGAPSAAPAPDAPVLSPATKPKD
ncbi:MAG TPA: peptidylprolyl isomerase [Stellaceae bacterium]|nr:peptidylprolyl isomerase [Stellaceae bacterium]